VALNLTNYEIFASATVRDSWIPSPKVGQACTLLDTGEHLIYYGPIAGWCPPWNTAWGLVGEVISASTHAVEPVDSFASGEWTMMPELNIGITPVVGRTYEVSFAINLDAAANGCWVQVGAFVNGDADARAGHGSIEGVWQTAFTGTSPTRAVMQGTASLSGAHRLVLPVGPCHIGMAGFAITAPPGAYFNTDSMIRVADIGAYAGPQAL
jgi:hypothetical protein